VLMQRAGENPMGNAAMYEARPVGGGGDNPLYAQTLSTDPTYSSSLGAAHVGKRRPYLDETQGMKDFRLTKVGVGSNGPGTLSATPTASLPPLPYSSNLKTKFTGKETKMRPSDDPAKLGGIMPGYTGYVHGRQHVYGTSYGHVSRKLTQDGDANETMTQRSGRLVGYAESKPHGSGRLERGKQIPGYGGHVPKKVMIVGRSYGTATGLAPSAEACQRAGGDPLKMPEMYEQRPVGSNPERDLYAPGAKPKGADYPYVAKPLPYRVSKGTAKMQYKELGEDNKWRYVVLDDDKTVREGKHRLPGYTGYTHGRQHVYAQSVGKMTRQLGSGVNVENTTTPYALLNYRDPRPQYENTTAPSCL
jgi:hypothetical protein